MSTVPPLGASTRAAALARRKAKSTVSGNSPTRPRTPSVPKYLRPIELISLADGGRDAHRVQRGRHVVGAHDTRSVEDRNGSQGHAAGNATFYRSASDFCQHGLARQAYDNRCAKHFQRREVLEQRQVVRGGFPETESGIDGEARRIDAGITACTHARREETADVFHDIVVVRC